MNKRIITTLVLVCSTLFCIAAALDLSGKWKGELKTDDGGDYPLTYVFKVDGDKLGGNVQSPTGDLPITDGKIKGDSVFFNVQYNGADIPNSGKCYADSIAMNIVLSGSSYHTVLKKDN